MHRTIRRLIVIATLVGLLGATSVASAGTDSTEESAPEGPGVTFSMTTGVLAPVLLETGELFGAYLYVGPNAIFPVSKKFAVIAGAGFEVAPKKGNYGAVGQVIGEYLATPWLGLDAIALVSHDEDPTLEPVLGRSTTAYVNLGGGASFFLPNGLTISPMATYDINVDGLGASISPSLFVSIPFP